MSNKDIPLDFYRDLPELVETDDEFDKEYAEEIVTWEPDAEWQMTRRPVYERKWTPMLSHPKPPDERAGWRLINSQYIPGSEEENIVVSTQEKIVDYKHRARGCWYFTWQRVKTYEENQLGKLTDLAKEYKHPSFDGIPIEDAMRIQRLVIELRRRFKISREGFGKLFAISRDEIRRWEMGVRYPDPKRLEVLHDMEARISLWEKKLRGFWGNERFLAHPSYDRKRKFIEVNVDEDTEKKSTMFDV